MKVGAGLAIVMALSSTVPRGEAKSIPRPSVALFYGSDPPLDELAIYDWAVVEPGAVTTATAVARLAPAIPIAYVALGEAHPSVAWFSEIRSDWVLGNNPHWGGRVLDVADPGWRRLLLETVLPELWARGFRGFFFDALDSHVSVLDSKGEVEERWAALAELIREVRARWPEATLIANRGFEVLDRVAPQLNAVAAESGYAGWNPEDRSYRWVPKEDRRWLWSQLARATAYGLTTICIDYLPPGRRREARKVARRLARDGHVPWVAPLELDALGVGALEVLPREVLLIYDSEAGEDVADAPVHRFLALPLEYLGLVPRYIDIRQGLPEGRLSGRVAGVVTWLAGRPMPNLSAYRRFLLRLVEEGVPLVIFGLLGEEANDELLDALALRTGPAKDVTVARISHRSELLGFEAPPRALALELQPLWSDQPGFEPLLEVEGAGIRSQPILIAPWGGVALEPYLMAESEGGEGRWVVNPFEFLRRALQLPKAPVIDPTTENGRRLLITHIDGDGAVSRVEGEAKTFALTKVRRFLERHPFPHTVSFVEGEVSSSGLYAEFSRHFEREARRMFALPYVEPASHGFSHPFIWSEFEKGGGRNIFTDRPPPSVEREIAGSLAYASELAGREVDLFLWTGDALPGPKSMAVLNAEGAVALNGGFTVMTDTRPSVTHVSPLGRPVGEYFQIYAPVMNENDYTDGWQGPYWGYRRVRETFDRTGKPRRLIPLGIYYHFYSGTKEASLRALEQVYADALARSPLPIFASEWVHKVKEVRRSVLARTLQGDFVIDRVAQNRTLRLPSDLGRIDFARSQGVVGERRTGVGHYVHLDENRRARIRLTRRRSRSSVTLVHASAQIQSSERDLDTLRLNFEGPPPVEVVVAGGRCRSATPLATERTPEGRRYLLRRGLGLVCRRSNE